MQAVLLGTVISAAPSNAAEGASSNYFPGSYGNLLVAAAPEPGFIVWSQNLFYGATAERAVLQGRVNVDLETDAYFTLINAYWVHDLPSLGARFLFGGFLPFGYASLEAGIAPTAGPAVAVEEDRFAFGDMAIVPASLYWSLGPLQLNAYQTVIAPTGQYDADDAVNIGRNYWSFDSVLAATWFHESSATDVSAVLGVMANTENPDSDYRTGTELHLDFMLNQFLAETFGVGFHGYWYEQVSGDSGAGAILGGFEGSSVGLGVAGFWIPAFADGKLALTGKWIRDVDASNRLEGDYGVVDIVFAF